jgi:hypothetical protein
LLGINRVTLYKKLRRPGAPEMRVIDEEEADAC